MPGEWSRREFIRAAAVGVVGLKASAAAAQSSGVAERTVYLGTYTNDGSPGIYICRFDDATGALRIASTTESVNPSFLTLSDDGGRLYAVNELEDYQGQPSGGVSAFEVDRSTGGLRFIDEQPSKGGSPCYLTTDRGGRYVLVANYNGGNAAVLPVRDDGGLAPARQVVQHTGSGPNRQRQEKPHVHSVTLDPAQRFALVADLGIDRVMVYGFDHGTGALTPAPAPWAQLAPGTGPRHLAFSSDGSRVYVIGEMASSVTAFHYDAERGAMREFQSESLLPADFQGENTGADIHFGADGRFLYASNRGHDSIVVFAVDAATGRLSLVQHQPSGGAIPRNFAIDPTGRFLLAAHQRSGGVVSFRIDSSSGRLTPAGQALSVPSPVCVRFAP
jgi:6-phosphogluconolactonase